MRRLELTGQRFGRLTALTYQGNKYWQCHCDCGAEKAVLGENLRTGMIRSCGCLRSEITAARSTTHGQARTQKSRLYAIWTGMKSRCRNPNRERFRNYGGRGVVIYPEWLDFTPFRDWACANGYVDNLTIDRIDNDGNYEPGNCRWIPMAAQQRNSRRNHLLTFEGKTLPLVEWAETRGLSRYTLSTRLARHWPVEKALTQPVGVR
jgi:hypothetical protein